MNFSISQFFTQRREQNMLIPLGLGLVLLFVQPGCKKTDGYNSIASADKTKPAPVTNVKVANFAGGAYITYTLPDSKNILYVQAQYSINDKISRQTKSSYYSDSLTVSGFARSQDYKVVLYTVSRADVRSDSQVVIVHPDTPAYLKARPTVILQKDFGGINVTAINTFKAPIGVITITPDAKNKLQIVSQNYSQLDTIQFSLRGFDTVSRKFGVYITDQWGNISDTVFSNIVPIFESQMDKSKFQAYSLPSDAVTDFGWVLPNLWDGNTGSPGFHTQQPIHPLVWPATIIPAGIFLDWVLLKTKSFVLTSILGGMVWTLVFWTSNYMTLAPYLQPTQFMGHILTVADVQGIQYLRSQTPEYLRLVENGTLRSFLEETQYVSLVFGATLTVAGYWIGQAIARWLAIWPIGRFMKQF